MEQLFRPPSSFCNFLPWTPCNPTGHIFCSFRFRWCGDVSLRAAPLLFISHWLMNCRRTRRRVCIGGALLTCCAPCQLFVLPEPLINIPREKHVPKEKPMTKWEKFAKQKGITKKGKDKLAWDNESKDWKPLHGYRSKNNEKQWCMEVPVNGDPNADYFAKAKEVRKEKIAKNEYQRLRNVAAASKSKVTNLESVDMADKQQLSRSLSAAKTATASIGRFTDKLPHEKAPKNAMKKRQFKTNVPKNMKEERENNLKIFQTLDKKNPKLNIQEAVQRHMTKPLKEGEDGGKGGKKPKKSKKNKFVKNLFRGGKNTKSSFKKRS